MDITIARERLRRKYTKLQRQCVTLKKHKEETPVADLPLWSLNKVAGETESDRVAYDNLLQRILDGEPDEDNRAQDEDRADDYQASLAEANDLSLFLLSIKSCYQTSAALTSSTEKIKALYEADPTKNYSTLMKCVKDDLDKLKRILEKSPMPPDHPQRVEADKVIDSTYLLFSNHNKAAEHPTDVKPTFLGEDGSGIKMTPFNPPKFGGEQKDWIAFRSEFRSIHKSPRCAPATKLSYLRQAMQNPSLRRQISTCIDNGDSYDVVTKMLQDQFDRPRLTHKIFVDQLLPIGQVKPYKSSILDCANTLQSVWDGLTRLGQCDAQSLFTTIVESWLPKELRIRWEDETLSSKTVPPVQDLITFLRLRATQPQYEDKVHHSNFASEKKSSSKKHSSHQASVHVVSGQPVQPVEPQNDPSINNSYVKNENKYQKSKSSFPCKYTCPLCQEAHYAYNCKVFKSKNLTQRMEFVVSKSLCVKCLKAGHTPDVCRNTRTCSVCQAEHNTLLHGASSQTPSQPVISGTINAVFCQYSEQPQTQQTSDDLPSYDSWPRGKIHACQNTIGFWGRCFMCDYQSGQTSATYASRTGISKTLWAWWAVYLSIS